MRGTAGSDNRATSTAARGHQAADQWMNAVDVRVHARDHDVAAQPEGEKAARCGVTAEDDPIPLGHVARVFHTEIELVRVEVGDHAVGLFPAQHVRGREPALAPGIVPVLDPEAGAQDRVPGRGDVARRNTPGASVCRCSSTATPPSAMARPAAAASSERGSEPTPSTTRSAGMRCAVSRQHRLHVLRPARCGESDDALVGAQRDAVRQMQVAGRRQPPPDRERAPAAARSA